MHFGVLGPLYVAAGDPDTSQTVSAPRLRAVLAVLLWRANQPVPMDELADLVWDGVPPDGAPEAIRALVMRLRRRLDPQAAARIVTRSPGYAIEVSSDELDASRFETLTHQADSAVRAGQWPEATRAATGALSLWRGAPLMDVPSQLLRDRWAPKLELLHAQALTGRIEADLHQGRHEQLITELRELTARHPLQESLHGQLMLALARSGRRGEALAAYHVARRALATELGVDPSSQLRRLHEQVLAGDASMTSPAPAVESDHGGAAHLPPALDEELPLSLDAPPRTEGLNPIPVATDPQRVPPDSVTPHQIPAGVRHFVGRTEELNLLSSLLGGQATASAVVISHIGGTAGIGKTALAVHWAHSNADRFPDGQLYVDLRGFDPSGTPLAPADVVRRFLAALDVPARQIPIDQDELTALYRSRLANRQMLVLLDNARDSDQVRPLLPGTPGCLVLVTSRNELRSLVARDGATPLMLGLLTMAEARDLLIRRLGHERLATDEHIIDELIELCARLPLALNLAAALAALRPTHSLSSLVDELRDSHQRLDTLRSADDTADIRAVFSWSYRTLGPAAARVFRLLSVHPGPDISVAAAASLTALAPERVRDALHELTAAYLIDEQTSGRYTFHDLLRVYAAERTHDEDSGTDRRDAVRRMCDFYTHSAHGAVHLLVPQRPPVDLAAPAPGTFIHPMPDATAATAWFDAEHRNLLAAQHAAIDHGWYLTVWQLAWDLTTFHALRSYRHEQLAVCQAALRAAAHLTELHRMRAHRLIGIGYADLGRHQEAIHHLEEALALAGGASDRTDQAQAHRQLAWAWGMQGDDRQAMHHSTRALALFRTLDDPIWEASALNAVGWYAARLGDYDTARTSCQAARQLYQKHDNRHGEADTIDSLGYIEHRTGHHREAIAYYQEALTLYRSITHAYETANVFDNIGHPYAALGQHQQARTVWRHALELYRQQGRDSDAERVQRQLDALER